MRRFLVAALMLAASPAFAAEGQITLDIRFSDAALARLQGSGETVKVDAWYEGEPTAAGARHAEDGMGLVFLGAETYEIWPRAQAVTLGGTRDGLPLDWVVAPMLTVNVYSARRIFQDNLLNCDLVSGSLNDLADTHHDVLCRLIEE